MKGAYQNTYGMEKSATFFLLSCVWIVVGLRVLLSLSLMVVFFFTAVPSLFFLHRSPRDAEIIGGSRALTVAFDFLRMGDHFVLLVDRLLTESTLEAAIQSKKLPQIEHPSASGVETENKFSLQKRNFSDGLQRMVECRICHDEDENSNMETPCSCSGSLKYAHRKCVQRWCDEKGNTVCEICHQQFKPDYTAPPQLFHYGSIPMNFRGNWEISMRDLPDPRLVAMVATDRDFLHSDYDTSPSARSIICCRAVAIIFMALLVLRHALPFIVSGDEDYSFTLFILLLLRAFGILLAVYIMARGIYAFQRRRQQQAHHELPFTTSDDEQNEQWQPQPHLMHVH